MKFRRATRTVFDSTYGDGIFTINISIYCIRNHWGAGTFSTLPMLPIDGRTCRIVVGKKRSERGCWGNIVRELDFVQFHLTHNLASSTYREMCSLCSSHICIHHFYIETWMQIRFRAGLSTLPLCVLIIHEYESYVNDMWFHKLDHPSHDI